MVYTTLDLLMNLLPGKAADTVSDVLQTHSGIGLGLAVNRLLAEHFVDIAPSQVCEGFSYAAGMKSRLIQLNLLRSFK